MNLPNKITLTRILMVPIFIWVLLSGIENSRLIAALIFAIASVTDFLDGYLARKYDLVSDFGKLMDPMADKILVASALIGMVQLGRITVWPVVIILAREFLITSFRSLAASKGSVIAASIWGKIKTNTQIVAIILLTLTNNAVADVALWISVGFTIMSAVDYIVKNRKVIS
ncbi:MAG: CDP-diacylglycerol--glycerol-3-phosphate 3-phosphatidyltransferase [Peptostreptococcaceae bacterium]|nr:CDP-diacylglycerol--glycerol-3-phosphate 3-phosphatidyltransferase [Peptostreptococcaceae bacterium]